MLITTLTSCSTPPSLHPNVYGTSHQPGLQARAGRLLCARLCTYLPSTISLPRPTNAIGHLVYVELCIYLAPLSHLQRHGRKRAVTIECPSTLLSTPPIHKHHTTPYAGESLNAKLLDLRVRCTLLALSCPPRHSAHSHPESSWLSCHCSSSLPCYCFCSKAVRSTVTSMHNANSPPSRPSLRLRFTMTLVQRVIVQLHTLLAATPHQIP